MAVVIETREMIQTVIASVVGGVGVTVIFAIAVWGASRYSDLSRNDQPIAAGGAAALSVLSLGVVAASIVVGIVVMTSK